MKIRILLIVLVLSSFLFNICGNQKLYAQPPSIKWQHCLGGTNIDAGVKVKQTPDGGYVLLCSTSSSDGDVTGFHGTSDIWLVRLDSSGGLLWQRCYGGSSGEMPNDIINKSGGGFIIAAGTSSTNGDVTGLHGSSDMWIVNIDDSGNIVWEKCYGGSDGEVANLVVQTFDGGYIISGVSESSDGDLTGISRHNQGDFWVLKIDSSGTIQWQKCFGGNDLEYSCNIIQSVDSGYVVMGSTLSTDGDMTGIPISGMNVWTAKLDVGGNILWKCPLVGTLGGEFGKSIIHAPEGGFYISASCDEDGGLVSGIHSNGFPDYWIIKIDSGGVFQWQKCLGGTSTDEISDICSTDDGGLAAIGYTISNDGDVSGVHEGLNSFPSIDFWIVKLDSSGTIEWQKCLGGSGNDYGGAIAQTIGGGLIVTGSELTFNDGDVSCSTILNDDVWVVKLDSSNGNLIPSFTNEKEFNIYYSSHQMFLEVPNYLIGKQFNMVIYDELGNIIIKKNIICQIKAQSIKVDLINSAMYIVQLISNEGTSSKKIIVH